MADLLFKFRINYSSLKIVSLSDKPQAETIVFFNDLIKDFISKEEVAENGNYNMVALFVIFVLNG